MTSESLSTPLPPQTHLPLQQASSGNHSHYSDSVSDPSTQHSSGDVLDITAHSPGSPRGNNNLELHDVTLVAEPESHKSDDSELPKQGSDIHSEENVISNSPPTASSPQDQAQPDMPTVTDALQGLDIIEDWDPLRGAEDKEQHRVHDATLVVEEGDVVDSKGRLLFTDDDIEPSPAVRRTSHLCLDIKPPSPQPWDLVEPPTSNNDNKPYYSPNPSQKFHTMQSAPSNTRPLIPKSSYYFGPPPSDSAYGTPPMGQIGIHHPREILRVERDYTGGEVIQFAPIYPLEIEGRITPTQFLESINSINEVLISAHSLRHAFLDNMLAVFSLQLSRLFLTTHYEKEMQRLKQLIDDLNVGLYNPVGLNILWPRDVAFLFLEIEYY